MAKLTPEKIEQMKEWQAQTDAFNEKQKAKAQEAAQAKKFLIQSNAVRWLQPQATNGDASAQCSLGLHYLNGQGCETNREQAIYWLTQAANQGDQEASNKLASLKK
jgi:TPR repeat protein